MDTRFRIAALAGITGLMLAAGPAAAEGDAAKGEKIFARCKACHTIEAGGPNRVGPNLHGVYGREAGKAEGFKYSNVVAESGIVWTPENLDAYLTAPAKFLKGNRMAFAGLAKPEERADIIAYLASQK
ncbi:cytochrome c family protein [Tistrella mobilis]|jgi:cytochrome c|uniref:c-type cytochrome n=1 Tax=Tistrella mobilis TaxID=171437 RepID=UPI003556052F